MDKENAKRIIKKTFEYAFDKAQFTNFIKNVLNHIEETPQTSYQGNYIPDAYQAYINQLERIGKFIDPEGKKLDILIIHLKKQTSLERARTMQRNFIGWYLDGSRGGVLKDAALVAYVSPDQEDWRFSFVKMEYNLDVSGDKAKVKQELTPARRYSFLVGKNENSHTAQSQLVPLLCNDAQDPTIKELEDAFSIEKVTKDFFEKYRNLFDRLKESVDSIVVKDEIIREEFKQKNVDTSDFSKKLLGQIVFLYFLQKKGWFGVRRDDDWGTGPKNFLRRLFEKKHGDYKNFFNDILEPLFYNTLAIERPFDYSDRFNCKIPFLNGGLFDPLNNYNWVKTDILLPDELFSNGNKIKEGDDGTGILDVFDLYNFTVKEDEPLEKEVAVDPEMLGKVFENLLEVKDRKSKGTYYTPREIVHYMCQESLINYLKTELGDKVDGEDIKTLIKYGDLAIENDLRVERIGKETDTYSYKLSDTVRQYAQLIDDKLKNIRVCDPAIGSGAFPVGMMNEIVRARKTLTNYLKDEDGRTEYDFKRHAIHECLFGVDIDPGAVEIAKLRLWLSLVVDEEDIKQIKPLPNLDYKIMQGNSLLEEYDGIKLIDYSFFKKEDITKITLDDINEKFWKLNKELIELHKCNLLTPEKQASIEEEQKQLEKQKRRIKKEKDMNNEQMKLQLSGVSIAKQKAERLLFLYKLFFETYQKTKKDKLKEDIESLTWELIETTLKEEGKEDKIQEIEQFKENNIKPFFIWHLHFAEVFQEKGGFDVVIANPPYVRQEKIKPLKPFLQKEFDGFYCGTADLYTYFYKRGLDLVRSVGNLCFIAPNKFMRATYGKNTRNLLTAEAVLKAVVDFCELPVFESGTDPAIVLVIKKKTTKNTLFTVATIKNAKEIEKLNEVVIKRGFAMNTVDLSIGGWILEPRNVLELIEKIRSKGKPLGEYVNGRLYRGVLTGLNEAFVIDAVTRERLIAEDPASEKLIKPWLNGHNILRWKSLFDNHYLISIPSSANKPWPWSNEKTVTKAREIFEQTYPSLYNHLSKWENKLVERDDQGKFWWELRSCSYYGEFEKPKIVYNETSKELHAYVDYKNFFINKTGFIIISHDNEYLVGIFNSRLMDYYFRNNFPAWGDPWKGGRVQFRKDRMIQVPIVSASDSQKAPIIKRVQTILDNPTKQAQVKEYERQIDQMVYELYGLTEEEIKIIESK